MFVRHVFSFPYDWQERGSHNALKEFHMHEPTESHADDVGYLAQPALYWQTTRLAFHVHLGSTPHATAPRAKHTFMSHVDGMVSVFHLHEASDSHSSAVDLAVQPTVHDTPFHMHSGSAMQVASEECQAHVWGMQAP